MVSGIDLKVAQAVQETYPHEAVERYQQRAERVIAQRDRKHYQTACTYLAKMRTLYEKLTDSGLPTRLCAGRPTELVICVLWLPSAKLRRLSITPH